MRSRRYRRLLDEAAHLVALPSWECDGRSFPPGVWLEGLVVAESAGDPAAVRYEPHQDRRGRRGGEPAADLPDRDDGLHEDAKSYGLMQVMGFNLRELVEVPRGTPMGFGWALLPITNIAFGLRILLAELRATGGDVAAALARYNGGPTGDDLDADGRMRRQVYVDKVFQRSVEVLVDRRRAP